MDPATQKIVVEDATLDNRHRLIERIALFNEDGTPFTGRDTDFAPITTATAIGTAAKTTTSSEPEANTIVPIKFTNGNSAETPTVAFNGGVARAIRLGGTATPAAKITVAANGVVLFWFDGTVLHQLGDVS
jgi:hypothetical protein